MDIRKTLVVDQSELDNALQLAQVAQDQAALDSNDDEIDSLREALEFALALLGLNLPEGREPCSECGEKPAEEFGMCDGCLHDAQRSGWNPPSE